MKRICNIDELIGHIDTEVEIYILGAGKDGRSCNQSLLKNCFKIKNFVDEDRKKRGTFIDGIEVITPEDIIDIEYRKRIFLLCIGEVNFYSDREIEKMSICSHIRNKDEIVIIDRNKEVYERFLNNSKKYSLHHSESIMDLNRMILPNFLNISDSLKKIFLSECSDLIMPAIFNDYSMVDEGPYEIDEVQVEPGDIVIDAGANLGIFAAYAAGICKRVYAFEPIPKTLEYLQMTSKLYGNKIEIIDKALSNKNSLVKMTNKEYLGQNRICRYDFDIEELIDIEAITLDYFVKQYSINKIDFIKADIEGEERNLLQGADKVLREFEPKLSICTYHKEDDPEMLESIIKKINPKYKVIHKYKKLYAFVNE